MHRPPLTPAELATALDRQVAHLQSLGLDRMAATRVLAVEYGVPQERLAAVLKLEGGQA
jgi:hypothetical protein